MKKFAFDFDLDLWVQDVVIEAENEEKARRILLQMNVNTLLDQGYVKDYDIKQVDCSNIEEDDEIESIEED